MSNNSELFIAFLNTVESRYQDFVTETDNFLMNNNCKYNIKSAKNGFIVSYILNSTKKTIATFVFRKTGLKLRIYPQHINQYADFLNTLPDKMKKEIKKASVCKRLINPDECNSRCVMGYDFFMDNNHYQKCRYMAFMHTLTEENNPYIRSFLEHEINAL